MKLKNKTRRLKKPLSKERRIARRKILMIVYYSVAAIVILIGVGIILDNSITRTETNESEEVIYFNIKYEDDDSLELGTDEVKQAGENGLKKIYMEEKKKLITGTVLDFDILKYETIKEPVERIIRRGTRRWQYMICSDGTYSYYTDDQFQNPKVGFTHSSEDDCAKKDHGSMLALSDTLPTANSYTSDGRLSEDYVRAMEIKAEYEQELRDQRINSSSPTESFNSSINYNPFTEYEAKAKQEEQARKAAEDDCRNRAEGARKSIIAQLNILGASGSSAASTAPQEIYDSTYYNCMREYDY